MGTNGGEAKAGEWTAPYGVWKTLENTIERMSKDGGVPARLDRSYLSNLPGSAQSELQTTMKSLGLVDDQSHPTERLEQLVNSPVDQRPTIVAELLRDLYVGPLSLGPMATEAQLAEEFRKLGVSGSTHRKAVRFFLAAASFAGLSLSPHFKVPKIDSEQRPRRKAVRNADTATGGSGGGDETPPPSSEEAELHPFIKGLVSALPKPGAEFPAAKQEAWFDTARGIFKLMYEIGAGAHHGPHLETSSTRGGESD